MDKSIINELYSGYTTAYIDGSVASNISYRPQFVSNNHKEGKKVLSSIEDELLACDHFQISVAFKRVLFLVHRGQLARQTKRSYERVFGNNVSMGLVGAGYHEYDKDYVLF